MILFVIGLYARPILIWAADDSPCWCKVIPLAPDQIYTPSPLSNNLGYTGIGQGGDSSACPFHLQQSFISFDNENPDLSAYPSWEPQYIGVKLGSAFLGVVPDGNYGITVICKGFAYVEGGNPPVYYQKTVPIIIDGTPPQLSIDTPAEGAVLPLSAVAFSGTASDNNFVTLIYGNFTGTFPGQIFTIPKPEGNWSIQVATSSFQPGLSQFTMNSYALDAAGNGTAPECGGVPMANCATNPSLTRHFVLDGTPPQVFISTPAAFPLNFISSLENVSGTASDDIALNSLKLQIRDNSSNKYWNGSAFQSNQPIDFDIPMISTLSLSWNYPGLSDANLISGTSYTITAQTADSVDNLSQVFYSTFTFNLCAPKPFVSASQRTTINGQVTDSSAYLSGCSAFVCSRPASLDTNTGMYQLAGVSLPEMRSGVKVTCNDPSRTCPIANPLPRDDRCGNGAFNADRGNTDHAGSDFRSLASDLVLSAAPGTVIFVGQAGSKDNIIGDDSLGWIVVVKSLRNLEGPFANEYVIYAHLKPPVPQNPAQKSALQASFEAVNITDPFTPVQVHPGDIVSPGQILGVVDTTGNAMFCEKKHHENFQKHLHVEAYHSTVQLGVRRNNNPQIDFLDPDTGNPLQPRFSMLPFQDKAIKAGVSQRLNPDKEFGCNLYGGRK